MANTNGTTNADVIAQEALVQLKERLPILKQVASDYSDQSIAFGKSIIVHEVQAETAEEFNPTTGYVAKPHTQTDIPVTIDKHKHHTYSVGVQEASSSKVDLIKRYGLTAAFSLGSAVVTDLCNLVTNSNYPNKTVKALGAGMDGFDRKALLLTGAALSKRGVIPFGRFCLLNADYYASLFLDNSLLNLLVLSGQKVFEGGMPNIHNFGISEYTALPSPAGENLVGFCGGRTALGIATRLPDDPGKGFPSTCTITSVKDDETGLTLQVREWYNPDMGEFKRTYTLMYGVGKGQVNALQRIVSAAT